MFAHMKTKSIRQNKNENKKQIAKQKVVALFQFPFVQLIYYSNSVESQWIYTRILINHSYREKKPQENRIDERVIDGLAI